MPDPKAVVEGLRRRVKGGGVLAQCPLAKVYYVNSERPVFELLAQPPLEALQGMHIEVSRRTAILS